MQQQLNKEVLALFKNNAKNWALAEQSASEFATLMACDIEPFIDAKLKAKRTKHGKLLAEYRDEVDSVLNNVTEIHDNLRAGVVEGVLEGKTYKDYNLELYLDGDKFLAVDTAKVSKDVDFNPDNVMAFSMGFMISLDYGKLGLTENKNGDNNNPFELPNGERRPELGPSFMALTKSERSTGKNTIDQAWSRLKGRIAKALAKLFGEIKPDVDVLEKASKRSAEYFKGMQSLSKQMSAQDSKAVMAWLINIEQSYPLGK